MSDPILTKVFKLPEPDRAMELGLVPVKIATGAMLINRAQELGYNIAKAIKEAGIVEYLQILPEGYWYMEPPINDGSRPVKSWKAEPVMEFPHDWHVKSERVTPYVKVSESTNTQDYLTIDDWYFDSYYDVMILGRALFLTAISPCLSDYRKLFYKIKDEVISNSIKIPIGRDILLTSQCRLFENDMEIAGEDLHRHAVIGIDRKDYFKFLMERSGIDHALLPGAVIIGYERDEEHIASGGLGNLLCTDDNGDDIALPVGGWTTRIKVTRVLNKTPDTLRRWEKRGFTPDGTIWPKGEKQGNMIFYPMAEVWESILKLLPGITYERQKEIRDEINEVRYGGTVAS